MLYFNKGGLQESVWCVTYLCFWRQVMLYFNKGGSQENRGEVTDVKIFLSSDELYTHCQRNSATQSQV